MPRTHTSQPTPTNEQRARRARAAVIAYRKAADTDETRQATLLTDLLADLMHHAGHCNGVDFDLSLDMARSFYTAEFLREALAPQEEERARAVSA